MKHSTDTTQPWAVRLPPDKVAAAAALRLWPGVRVCPDDETSGLWLRGDELSQALELELRKLPGAERFTINRLEVDDVLVPVGRQLPEAFVPTGEWTPIADWFRPVLPVAALPAVMPVKTPVNLVRSGRVAESNVLVTSSSAWAGWVTSAPRLRLRRLSFAASDDQRVVVRGSPQPPIPGRAYTERQGIAVPNGWEIHPAVDAATMRCLLGLGETDLAILHEDGRWERVPADAFVAASRSAVRATMSA